LIHFYKRCEAVTCTRRQLEKVDTVGNPVVS